jgi:hypothetical protein
MSKACLMNMADDATSTVEALLGEQETIWAAARVLRQWIEKYGVPLALYTDWKNVCIREPTEKELLHGKVPVTQFGRMCRKLDIRIIAASSPQAKERVERGNGTHQNRLIKKMGRQKIRTHQAANVKALLNRRYCSATAISRKSPRRWLCFTAATKTAWVATTAVASRIRAHRSGPIISSRDLISFVRRLAVAGLRA